jgi:hypothetical protein
MIKAKTFDSVPDRKKSKANSKPFLAKRRTSSY